MKLIFIVICLTLALVAYPFLRLWASMRSMRRGVRRAQQQARNAYNQPEKQGRVLNDVEEDAEFETIDTPRTQSSQSTPHTHFPTEDQVTDAEFEEVK